MGEFDVQKLSGGKVAVRAKRRGVLSRKKNRELIDLLRRNFLYQRPRPIFAEQSGPGQIIPPPEPENPRHVEMKIVFPHFQRILELISEAGGWTLPPAEKIKIMQQHEAAARRAVGNGVDYNFLHLTYGDLVAMHTELEGVTELSLFREAIEDELKRQREERNG